MSKLTLTFKGTVLKSYPLTGGQIFIGSDPSCEIHIDSLAVEGKHACVTTMRHSSVVEDVSTEAGSQLNGKPLSEPQTLHHDDVIQVGKHTLVFTAEPSDLQESSESEQASDDEPATTILHAAKKNAWMQILNGANVGKTISLNRTLTNLGKSGVQLAVIARRGEGYYLSHLEGELPTTVDGKDIGDQSYLLEDGNVIQIGNIRMQFTLA